MEKLPHKNFAPIVCIGDALHAMTPFSGIIDPKALPSQIPVKFKHVCLVCRHNLCRLFVCYMTRSQLTCLSLTHHGADFNSDLSYSITRVYVWQAEAHTFLLLCLLLHVLLLVCTGNGANMAFVDAWQLALQLTKHKLETLEEAIAEFDAEAAPRCTAAVQEGSANIARWHRNGLAYHVQMVVYYLLGRLLLGLVYFGMFGSKQTSKARA